MLVTWSVLIQMRFARACFEVTDVVLRQMLILAIQDSSNWVTQCDHFLATLKPWSIYIQFKYTGAYLKTNNAVSP